MRFRFASLLGSFCFTAFLAATLPAFSATAPEFPPGAFSDGGHYKLSDLQGKVVVLFFYEQDCPRCRGLIPERNKIVDQFKDKPVKFIAVAPGDSLIDAISYTRATHLKMPSFSDVFGVMQSRYGFKISLQNIYQFRIIGPKGDIVGRNIDMNPADIESALASATWKYKGGGYHASLSQIIDALEWGNYEPAVRALKPLLKAGNKDIAASANKLMDAVKEEGKAWSDEAAKAMETDPAKAYDLYRKVSAVFVGDDLGKQATEALKPLAKNKAVTDELAARQMYDQMTAASVKAMPNSKPAFVRQAETIATKYPEAPTGKLAKTLAEDLKAASAE